MDFKDCMSFAGAISDYHDGGSVTPEYPLRSVTLPGGERVLIYSPATERETVSITIRKPSSVFIDHDTFVKQGFYSRLNQGGKFRDKEDELSSMFKDNCFEQFVPECTLRVKRWYFAGTGRVKPPLQMPVFSTYPIIYDVFQLKIQMKQSSGSTKSCEIVLPVRREKHCQFRFSLRSGFRMNRTESS
uniref:ATPase required for both assembly of type IV secretion complex and secretion of T-DNA complex, VirB11 n=1 Tax=Escherichia coli TaxID=562 RepID=A0A2K9UZM3_ECOLX|nr:ATPase required for both assembly of type IV secretion complex and secretion of T-DNA complex, VirB11 [Escherichia coli]